MRTIHTLPVLVIFGACIAFPGCSRSSSSSSDDERSAQTDDKVRDESPETRARPADDKRPVRVAKIAEADARAFLDRWLEVQNNGDFASYESLYAKRFEGVRRSGPKVVRLDRAGWMKERGRMFKRKMEVELSDIELDLFAQSAVLTFTQRWASGKYQDIGPKQLVVTREGDGLRIAREEMLSSTLIDGAKATALADENFLFLIEEGGTSYAVLDELGQVPTGARTLVSQGESVVVKAAVSRKDLPVAVARWHGQKLDLGGCTATIGEISAISRIVPHFGERQVWEGEFDENEPYTEAEIAAAAFYDTSAYLVGALAFDGAGCGADGYAFAAGNDGPIPDEIEIEPALETAIGAAAERAFVGLPAYKEIQKDFESYDHEGPWHEYDNSKGITVHLAQRPDGKGIQVVVTTEVGYGCGEFAGALTAHFEATGSATQPELKLVHAGQYSHEILATLDVDRDGTFEYLTKAFMDRQLVSWSGDTLRTISIGNYDCGC